MGIYEPIETGSRSQRTFSFAARVLGARAPAPATGDLPIDRPYREAREAFERLYFENLLVSENGSMSRVAERSGLERTHLYRKLKALGLPVGRREEGNA